jgi:hypothetical protein
VRQTEEIRKTVRETARGRMARIAGIAKTIALGERSCGKPRMWTGFRTRTE